MSFDQAERQGADKMLERVRALLAKAASTEHEAEALAFTAKAHELMEKYAIDQAQINAMRQAGFKQKPIKLDIRLIHSHTLRHYYDIQVQLMGVLARHNRCFFYHSPGLSLAHVVGFETDARFIEMLFTSLWEQMESRFRTDVVVKVNYKSKAKKGKVSFKPLNENQLSEHERGPHYRYEYMRGFVERIETRLQEQEANRAGSTEIVLANIKEQVDEFVGTLGLNLRPHRSLRTNLDEKARAAGMKAADRANLRPGSNLRQTPELPK